jgi:hypothetical protein
MKKIKDKSEEDQSSEGKVIVKMPLREALITQIRLYTLTATHLPKEQQAEMVEIAKFFEQHLVDITFSGAYPGEKESTITFKSYPEGEKIYSQIGKYLSTQIVMLSLAQVTNTLPGFLENISNLSKREEAVRQKEEQLAKIEKELARRTKHTKIAIHTVSQFYGDSKQLSLFSDEKIDAFSMATGLNITNRPDGYGVVLNQSQRRVLEGILKAFTYSNYKGDELKDKATSLTEIYSDTESSATALVKGDGAPYRNIDAIPVIKLTQAHIIDLSGYDLKSQRLGDKQDVIEALSFLATKQFCFYWIRLKTEKGKPVKDKSGDYVMEEVMEVGTLLRIKTVRDQAGLLQYYEIQPSAPLLDQVNNYFLLVPNNWRDEVKQLTGKRASSYTYELLLWLRLQYERIRMYNKVGGKTRKPKPFKISKSWEDVAIALKMPETMYRANRKRASKIIQEAYSVAIKLGYLVRVENNGATDILYLNEGYYPKPGKLV